MAIELIVTTEKGEVKAPLAIWIDAILRAMPEQHLSLVLEYVDKVKVMQGVEVNGVVRPI